jgi:cytochrome c-type biogenesis protein CcmH/NrfG
MPEARRFTEVIRRSVGLLLAGFVGSLLVACAGPLAFVPITPLLSAALSTRGEDMRTSDQILALQKKGDWAGVTKIAQDKLLRDPSDANGWVLLGYSLLQLNQVPDAIAALNRGTIANPEDIDAWNLLAEAQRRAGQPGASTRTLERALSVDPTSPVTRFLLGEAYRENGQPVRAAEAYREAVRFAPRMALGWYGLGSVLIPTGTPAELDEIAARLAALDPGLAREFVKLRAAAKR